MDRLPCTQRAAMASILRTSILDSAIALRIPSKRRLKHVWFGQGLKRKELGVFKPKEPQTVKYQPGESLPFKIDRAGPGGQLPVYLHYKHGRTMIVTVLKKYTGDVEALSKEFGAVCDGEEVIVRPGKMYVKGKHSKNVKLWLEMMGF